VFLHSLAVFAFFSCCVVFLVFVFASSKSEPEREKVQILLVFANKVRVNGVREKKKIVGFIV